jgi:hypothetical protein
MRGGLLESFPETERDTADDHNHHKDDERHANKEAKGRGWFAAGKEYARRIRLGHISWLRKRNRRRTASAAERLDDELGDRLGFLVGMK